jgi:hypothetical protein
MNNGVGVVPWGICSKPLILLTIRNGAGILPAHFVPWCLKGGKGVQKTGGLPQVAASRYDSPISLPGAGDGISKFAVNQ